MPRRPTPLQPQDGPGARFALELRALRDELGAHAPSVDDIADREPISRATIYAALNGRIPSRSTLEIIVRAWGGNLKVWLEKRRKAESELELLRRSRQGKAMAPTPTRKVRDPDDPWAPGRRSVSPEAAMANPAVQAFAAELRRLREAAGNPSLDEIRDGRFYGRSLRKGRGGVELKGAAVPRTTLFHFFRGSRFPQWRVVEKVVSALGGDVEEWRGRWVAMARQTRLHEKWVEWVERPSR